MASDKTVHLLYLDQTARPEMKVLRFLMFNPITRAYLKIDHWFLRWNKRLNAVVLEMWYTMALFVPCIILLFFPLMISGRMLAGDNAFNSIGAVFFITIMVTLMNKDIFGRQSVVHRLLGFQVVDVRTNASASRFKCMLRNTTAPIWPVEILFLLVYPQRRLGDFIAGTKVIEVAPTDPELILNDIRTLKLDADLMTALLTSVAYATAATFYFQV